MPGAGSQSAARFSFGCCSARRWCTSAIFRSRLWHSMFHGISSKYHPLTQPVVATPLGCLKVIWHQPAPGGQLKRLSSSANGSARPRGAHQRCEKVRHCTPHALIALRHKGSGSRKTTAPSANEKAAHRPSAGRARIMGARFLTYFSLAQLFRLRLHFTRRATTPRRETVPT
jgi:hypothetical protein